MGNLNLSVTELAAGGGVLLVLFLVWRFGARRARATAEAARSGARLVSMAGRVAFIAGLIVAIQWAVIAESGDWRLLLGVLAVPALFAAYPLTRALTVTTVDLDSSRQRRGRR